MVEMPIVLGVQKFVSGAVERFCQGGGGGKSLGMWGGGGGGMSVVQVPIALLFVR